MATKIPPHNLGEVIDGCVAMIDNPEIPLPELMEIIPGPDFQRQVTFMVKQVFTKPMKLGVEKLSCEEMFILKK